MSISSQMAAALTNAGPGQLRKHENFRSRFLPAERDLIVYLTGVYSKNPKLRFPVLYLQDGQNLFDPNTSFVPGMYWRVGETADRLIQQGLIRPLVIIGIYNTGKRRIREYTPSRDKTRGGGGADRYGRMLLEEIKPFIESEYRLLPGPANTGIGGSSLGGLLALYLGLQFADVFGNLAALSPSVWWDRRWILKYVARLQLKSRPRIWLDVGTQKVAAPWTTSPGSTKFSSRKAGKMAAICISRRSLAASTTKYRGRSASPLSCNSCFPQAIPQYNPRVPYCSRSKQPCPQLSLERRRRKRVHSQFSASPPTKKGRNSCAPARSWVASSCSSP